MTDIFILHGFLGSGKTSTLDYILHGSTPHHPIAAIIGEFAEEDYDGERLQKNGFQLDILTGQATAPERAVQYIERLQARLKEEKYSRIFLEMSGAVQIRELIAAMRDAGLDEQIQIQKSICVLSAPDVSKFLTLFPQHVQHQLAVSDLILLNKIDCVPEPERGPLRARIQEIQPNALVQTTYMGQIARSTLFAPNAHGPSNLFAESEGLPSAQEPDVFVYRTEKTCYDRIRFGHTLLNLPQNIVRFKGSLVCHDRSWPLNGLPGQLDWETHATRDTTNIVIMGYDILDLQDDITARLNDSLIPASWSKS